MKSKTKVGAFGHPIYGKGFAKMYSNNNDLKMEANNDALMAEVRRYWSDNFDYLVGDNPTLSIITNIARHFADWQNERMAKSMPLPEDTVLFQKGVAEGRRLEREDMTWQDCKRIVEIADALTEYAEAGIIEPFLASEEAYYQEVLRKFKEDEK